MLAFGTSIEAQSFQEAGAQTAAAPSEAPAQAVQNPFSSLTIVLFQNGTNFKQGPYSRTPNVLAIQPMIPVQLNANWSVSTWINATVAYQPDAKSKSSSATGLGDVQPMFFFSPVHPNRLIWGLGPTLLLPTATDELLETGRFSAGPALVVLTQPGPWTIGAMVNNLFSRNGEGSRKHINQLLLNPFVNYNLPGGWYLTTQPALTADWTAKPGSVWTVPVGGGFGRIVKIGPQLVNTSVASYLNAVRDKQAAHWQLAVQFMLLYPK